MKEVGRPSDMDNNQMLSLIEQKMCVDERRIWSRELEKGGKSATLQNLMDWMVSEIKSRMRATAALKNPNSRSVNQFTGEDSQKKLAHKCWLCANFSHGVDQCERFNSLNPDERLKLV